MASTQQAVRVDPNYPLPSPKRRSQSVQKSPYPEETVNPENGLGRTTSRKRRVSGHENNRNTDQSPRLDSLPPAHDAPRAPPVSYRNPYDNTPITLESITSPKSFAARARTIPDNVNPRLANSLIASNVPVVSNNRHTRHRSVHSAPASGNISGQGQPPSVPRESNPDPAWPQSAPNGVIPRKAPNLAQASVQQGEKALESPLFSSTGPLSTRSGSRRVSTGTAESPSDWASNRSPLQKLEVKLSDISKEEKRARVQEAEQLLRESKLAKSERKIDQESMYADPTISKREPVRNSEARPTKSAAMDRFNGKETMNNGSVRQATRDADQDSSGRGYDTGLEQRRNVSEPVNTGQVDARSSTIPYRAASQGHSRQDKRRSVNITRPDHHDRRNIRPQRNEINNQAINDSDRNHVSNEADKPEFSEYSSPEVVGTSSGEHQGSFQPQSRVSGSQDIVGTPSRRVPPQQAHLYASRAGRESGHAPVATYDGQEDPVPGRNAPVHEPGPKYETTPQTASGIDAKRKIGFGGRDQGHRHHLSNLLHHDHNEERKSLVSQDGPLKPLDEWRQGAVAHLSLADISADSEDTGEKKAWWEGKSSRQNQKMGVRNNELKNAEADRGFEDRNGIVPFSLSPILEEPPSSTMGKPLSSSLDDIQVKHDIDYDETLMVLGRNRPWLRPPTSVKTVRFSDNV